MSATTRRQVFTGTAAATLAGVLGASRASAASQALTAADAALLAACARLRAVDAEYETHLEGILTIEEEHRLEPQTQVLADRQEALRDQILGMVEDYPGDQLSPAILIALARLSVDSETGDSLGSFSDLLATQIVRDLAAMSTASAH